MSNYVGSVPVLATYTILNSTAIALSAIAIIYQIRQKIQGEVFTKLLFWNAIYLNLPFLIINLNPYSDFACNSQAFLLASAIHAQICIMPAIAWSKHHFFFNKTHPSQLTAYVIALIYCMGNLAMTAFLGSMSQNNLLSAGYCFYEFKSVIIVVIIIFLLTATILSTLWYYQIYREVKKTELQVITSLPAMANSPRRHRPSTFMREEPLGKHKIAGKKLLSYVLILVMWYVLLIGFIIELASGAISEGFGVFFFLMMSLNNILVSYFYTRTDKKKEIGFNLESPDKIGRVDSRKGSDRRATLEPRVQIVVHNVPSSPVQPVIAISPVHLTPPSSGDDPKYKLASRFKNLSEGSEQTHRRDSMIVVYDPRSLPMRSPTPNSEMSIVSICPEPDG
jgi:hypothetical protein